MLGNRQSFEGTNSSVEFYDLNGIIARRNFRRRGLQEFHDIRPPPQSPSSLLYLNSNPHVQVNYLRNKEILTAHPDFDVCSKNHGEAGCGNQQWTKAPPSQPIPLSSMDRSSGRQTRVAQFFEALIVKHFRRWHQPRRHCLPKTLCGIHRAKRKKFKKYLPRLYLPGHKILEETKRFGGLSEAILRQWIESGDDGGEARRCCDTCLSCGELLPELTLLCNSIWLFLILSSSAVSSIARST